VLAMNYRGPHRVRIDRKPMPEILHPQDAIVRDTRSCICGSDLHLYNGSVPDTRVGMTFGHEFTGVVEQLGTGVSTLKTGDHVLVPFNVACGTCVLPARAMYGPIGTLVPIGNVVNKGITIRANQASVKRLLPRLAQSGDTIDRSSSAASSCEARCYPPRSAMCAAEEARRARSRKRACCVSQASRRTGPMRPLGERPYGRLRRSGNRCGGRR